MDKFKTGWTGKYIQFWQDTWLGSGPLKVKYAHLFHLAPNDEAKDSDWIEWSNGTALWIQKTGKFQNLLNC